MNIKHPTAYVATLPCEKLMCRIPGVQCAFSALTLLVGERGADLHIAQLMPLPLTVSCFSKIQTGFTFLVPAHLGSPGKGPLNGCVGVCKVVPYLTLFFSIAWLVYV